MNADTAKRLEEIVAVLDEHIAVLRDLGFSDSAMILRIAKLDLQTKIHGISEGELRALSDALEARLAEPAGAIVIDLLTRRART